MISQLRTEILEPLKRRFIGRDEVADLIALAVVAGEHLFLHGPPGTAKSAIIRQFAEATQGQYFEYLLTRFSEPNELFGPIDLTKLREGVVTTVTTGMLPQADFAFLDELFNANSAILNSLLTVLNERVYRRGLEVHRLPLISLFAATNQLPEEESLKALFDRFLVRCHINPLKRDNVPSLLAAGWSLERAEPIRSGLSTEDLRRLGARIHEVDLNPVMDRYADLVFKVRDLGVELSDRRAVKILKLVAASALLCDRQVANPSDFWVFRYVWDRPEQIGPLRSLVDSILGQIEKSLSEAELASRHGLAHPIEQVDQEELARQLDEIDRELKAGRPTLAALARMRERLDDLETRACWVSDGQARRHLLDRVALFGGRLK